MMQLTKRQLSMLIKKHLSAEQVNEIGPVLRAIGSGLSWFWKSELRIFLSRMGWSLDGIGLANIFFDTPLETRLFQVFDKVFNISEESAAKIIKALSTDDKQWVFALHPELGWVKLKNKEGNRSLKARLLRIFDRLYKQGRETVPDPKAKSGESLKKSKSWQGGVMSKDPSKIPVILTDDEYEKIKTILEEKLG